MIYVFYDKNIPAELLHLSNNNHSVDIYKFNLGHKDSNTELTIGKDGALLKNIKLKGNGNSNVLTFRYESFGEKNKPVIVKATDLTNTLYPSEMITANYDNLLSILKQFKEIYIINLEKCEGDYCIARKVSIEPLMAKL